MKIYLYKLSEIYINNNCNNLHREAVCFCDGLDKCHESDILIIAKTTRPDPQGHGGF